MARATWVRAVATQAVIRAVRSSARSVPDLLREALVDAGSYDELRLERN